MKIEKYLILNKYLLSLFGINQVKDIYQILHDKKEDVDSNGRSYFVNTLIALKDLKIDQEDLLRYDENIQSYISKIKTKRTDLKLKYFQYLAVLFTEIVLDNLKNNKYMFLSKLNEFTSKYRKEYDLDLFITKKNKNQELQYEEISFDDLKKLAFWMATGSGKTLIMHINYHQFLNYNLFSPDNIILITPNEGLSKQHFEELQKSGIPSQLYNGNLTNLLKSDKEILIIEITKLTEEKKSKGLTLSIETFEGKNLVFVDEGHKGRKSEEQKWAKLRDKLANDGFTFEYSATFGQILNEKDPETLLEYSKSIIFDYSYKYFYLDGYGKDFLITNAKLTPISQNEFQEIMFIANLLSFYEQLLAYQENKQIAKEYNIEKPLWIFVGSTVTGKEIESDVIQIVKFLKKVTENENWLKEWIDKILNGKTNIKKDEDKDIFEDRFNYIKNKNLNLDDLYEKVFGGRGNLKLYEIKNSDGEIGLKIAENQYFGVINIGNTSKFIEHLEKEGIYVEKDVIHNSLFDNIKKENSTINILIGSKKFIEGWDTWRVSCMGLLNIGSEQGPQIIQLFGRGIRLKGKNFSLKRSAENEILRTLETLNIYGIKADYLTKFLETINKEEIEFETIEVPVLFQHQDKWKDLYTLSNSNKKFEEQEILYLKILDNIDCKIEILPKILTYQRKEEKIKSEEIKPKIKHQNINSTNQNIDSSEILDLLDWQKIYQEIIEFKLQRKYWNLIFNKDDLKNIVIANNNFIDPITKIFKIESEEDIKRIEQITILFIKKYVDLFYRKHARIFETQNLEYVKFEQIPLPFIHGMDTQNKKQKQGYILKIEKKKKDLIKKIKNLVNDMEKLIEEKPQDLPRIIFDRSLYVPILIESKEIDKISPPGLVESEKDFLNQLINYIKQNNIQTEVYLLRNNYSQGLGFQLKWAGFYPDFIMWIKKNNKTTIIFIDPKGLEHSKGLEDEKIQFAREIKEIFKAKNNITNITLESFIISKTGYKDLIKGTTTPHPKEKYIENHVLFLEDKDWPKYIFEKI